MEQFSNDWVSVIIAGWQSIVITNARVGSLGQQVRHNVRVAAGGRVVETRLALVVLQV